MLNKASETLAVKWSEEQYQQTGMHARNHPIAHVKQGFSPKPIVAFVNNRINKEQSGKFRTRILAGIFIVR